MTLRLGTRGSELARTQSLTIAARLREAGLESELTIIRTSGDTSDAPSFGSIGPQGVFVREIEQALTEGRIDLAVHSYKDLPTTSPDGLIVAAVPARVDPADVLIAHARAVTGDGFLPLRQGARVGTASARRQAWLRQFRPDLESDSLRGNVPTRLARLAEGRFDAILLAAAGLERLREAGDSLEALLAPLVRLRLDPARFVPAPSQGALAVQCRRDDAEILAALGTLDDAPSRAAVCAEREALARAEGGCDVAFGAFCRADTAGFRLTGMLERAGRVLSAEVAGREPNGLAAELFAKLDADTADGDRSE
jgi:hydroxymethylbilane synthase